MVQHIMLGLIAPVFLVAGIPASFVRAWLRFPLVARLERILGYPPLTLALANATFYVWHLPALYNLTLENETVHIFEHLTFLVTGTMLWWPVFKPIPEGRLAAMPAIMYLGIAGFLNTILGILFTISDTTYYACYAHPDDGLGALKLIRENWGLTQLADQKLGGAVMWEPSGAIFLWAMMIKMVEWFKEESDEESEAGSEVESEVDSVQFNARRAESVGIK
jgi:cytochrome c oxidase assembly factor CtaG